MSLELVVFAIASGLAIVSALAMVVVKTPVKSVISLVLTFFALAVLSILLSAPFIAALQVIVYAGAILVLFLFVVMLLNLTPAGLLRIDRPRMKVAGLAAAAGVVAMVILVAYKSPAWSRDGTEAAIRARSGGQIVQGDALPLSDRLFDQHLLPFEVTSILLLVAIVGSVALTKKKV